MADANQAASGADALLLLTEWSQFAALDWAALAPLMQQPAWLFDARAVADAAAARAAGLRVWLVPAGRGRGARTHPQQALGKETRESAEALRGSTGVLWRRGDAEGSLR